MTDEEHRRQAAVHSAVDELVALAAVMRPDWDSDRLRAAIMGARTAGWSWAQTFQAVARLMLVPDSGPGDLAQLARDPTKRQHGTGAPPNQEYRQTRRSHSYA